jgi:hypothetical protein
MDVLYNKTGITEATDQEEEEEEDMGKGDHEIEEEEELMVPESFVLEDYPRDAVLPDLSFSYKDVICKAWEVVKFFRHVRKHSFRSKSPTVFNHFCSACRGKHCFLCIIRNSPLRVEYLQERFKRLQLEAGKKSSKVNLYLDVKTQWNLMILMIESLLKVR